MFRLLRNSNDIDQRICTALRCQASELQISRLELPKYRYFDLYQAIEKFHANRSAGERIDSLHHEDLSVLLQEKNDHWMSRALSISEREAWSTSHTDQVFLPCQSFWLGTSQHKEVIRLRHDKHQAKAILEIASPSSERTDTLAEWLTSSASENSIFRGAILHCSYSNAKRDEYGDLEKAEELQLLFSPIEPISSSEIVLDDVTRGLIDRNIISLFRDRDALSELGVPIQRGVLFHGPPGTGKTFACRHICHELPNDVTRIFTSGHSLSQVNAVFSIARLLQPAVVFFEDADLMFESREINANTGVLGELMDQLDGLRSNEGVGVVMTTNQIDRMEAALKDRPGRIGQCVFLGAPDHALRERYLAHILRDQDISDLDLSKLAELADGSTQAFIKEWSFRATQISWERKAPEGAFLLLQDAFEEALKEMQTNAGNAAGSIVGFKVAST